MKKILLTSLVAVAFLSLFAVTFRSSKQAEHIPPDPWTIMKIS